MMINIWIAECDRCYATEDAEKGSGFYNGEATDYKLPDGWRYVRVKGIDNLLCPDCQRYLEELIEKYGKEFIE